MVTEAAPVRGRLSNPVSDSGSRSPSTGAYRIRKLSMSMEPESSADLDDPPAEMYSIKANANGSVVMNQHGLGKQARRSADDPDWKGINSKPPLSGAGSHRPSHDGGRRTSIDSHRPSHDGGRRTSIDGPGRRTSIDGRRRTSIDGPGHGHGGGHGSGSGNHATRERRKSISEKVMGPPGGGRSRRASISEKKKVIDPLTAMMNPVATHGGGAAKRQSTDGGRRQRRQSFAEREVLKCVMCKVEKPVTGEKLCRLCKD